MRTIVTIAMVLLLTAPCLAVESGTQVDEAKLLSSPCQIIFADQDLENASRVIEELKAQLADRERIISMLLSASAREASAARTDAEKEKAAKEALKAELAAAKAEIDVNKKQVLVVKAGNEQTLRKAAELKVALEKERKLADGELAGAKSNADKAKTEIDRLHKEMDHLNSVLTAKNEELAPVKIDGEDLVEDVLGPITVSKVNAGKMIVTVPANADRLADTRFLGAVIEKKRPADKVVYVLDASKLANKGNN